VLGEDCNRDFRHGRIEDRRNMRSGKCLDVLVAAGRNMLAEFGNRDCPPRSVPVDRGFKAAPGRCGRRRCGRASEEPAFELGKQLLKLKLFLPLFGDLPKDPARLVASVVMPGQRGVVRGDVLCDLSPLSFQICSRCSRCGSGPLTACCTSSTTGRKHPPNSPAADERYDSTDTDSSRPTPSKSSDSTATGSFCW
jgi:hypothetical protein